MNSMKKMGLVLLGAGLLFTAMGCEKSASRGGGDLPVTTEKLSPLSWMAAGIL
jgi:hypothetical protein